MKLLHIVKLVTTINS